MRAIPTQRQWKPDVHPQRGSTRPIHAAGRGLLLSAGRASGEARGSADYAAMETAIETRSAPAR